MQRLETRMNLYAFMQFSIRIEITWATILWLRTKIVLYQEFTAFPVSKENFIYHLRRISFTISSLQFNVCLQY